MKSKFFKSNLKKIALIAMLSSLLTIPNHEVEIEAAVAQDLTIYSGGGGGGIHYGVSFASANGLDGTSMVIFGDDAELFGTQEDLNDVNKYQLSGYRGTYSHYQHYDVFSNELMLLSTLNSLSGGGGVDGFSGSNVPNVLNITRGYQTFLTSEMDVAQFRVVSGDGGQVADPNFYSKYLDDIQRTAPPLVYSKTIDFLWDAHLNDTLFPANNGVTLQHSLGKVNLFNAAYIKSGSLGADIPTQGVTLPHNTLNTKVLGLPDRARGGNILLEISTLQLMDNNRLDIIKDSADVNVDIIRMIMTSNGEVVLDNMDNVGASRFLVNNFDFTGGTFTYNQLSNNVVDLTGTSLNVMSKNHNGDDIYDLLHSDDFFGGVVNFTDSTNKVLEYRLVSDSGTTVLPPNTTSANLNNYPNIHTIQAVFGYRADFESNGGTSVDPQTSILLNETVVSPLDPVRAGYTFEGWFSDLGLSSLYNFTNPVTQDLILYAKWNRIPLKYNLVFESNGGTNIDTQIVVEGNKGIEPLDPIRNQYEFLGWYTDQTFSQLYDFDAILTNNVTVYAKWSKIPVNVKLEFESDGGTSIPDQLHSEGSKGIKPNDPIKNQFNFVGWYIDQTFTSLFDFETLLYTNTVVYAKWEPVVSPSPDTNIPDTPTPSLPQPEEIETLPSTGISSQPANLGWIYLSIGTILILINRRSSIAK